MVSPVSGISRVTPPTTTNTCRARPNDRPAASSLPKASRTAIAVRIPRCDDDRVDEQQRHEAGQAELLADGGDDEVGLGERHDVRSALTEARCRGCRRCAMPNSPCIELVAAAGRVASANGWSQMSTRFCDMAEHVDGDERADKNSTHADDQPRAPLGRDVEHRDEQAEEEQRRAEVALEHEHRQAARPRDEHRPEVAAAGQVDAQHARADEREHVALDDEVAGEEHDAARASRPHRAGTRSRPPGPTAARR